MNPRNLWTAEQEMNPVIGDMEVLSQGQLSDQGSQALTRGRWHGEGLLRARSSCHHVR